MKKTTSMVTAVLPVAVGTFVIYPVWSNQVPPPVGFKPLTPQAFAGLIGWLFAVALFVERAVEVVVMVFRDQQADQLDEAEECAARDCTSAAKKAAADAIETARQALVAARQAKLVYRAETREIALLTGFVFGVFGSLAGVLALHGLLLEAAPTGNLFAAADIVMTGAMLAGGSEGQCVYQFHGRVSGRGDQAPRKANEDKKVS